MTSQTDAAAPRQRYRAVIVSPHLDDAVFSCGGTIVQMIREGPVLVLNLFTRYLSEVKLRGVVLGDGRYAEENHSASFLGYDSRQLDELDASFRRVPYRKLRNIFRPPVAEDLDWLPALREKVFAELASLDYQELYVPLGVGWHVDHVLDYLLFEPWAGREGLFYYEDAPYCCIPHSTRYRLDELANYPRAASDLSLAPRNAWRAWWQASSAYANTALMRNLEPWAVRHAAVPVVSVYLWRLLALHRRLAATARKRQLEPRLRFIGQEWEHKVDAMALYASQFREFFSSRDDCMATLLGYAIRQQAGEGPIERFWVDSSRDLAAGTFVS